VSNSSEGTVRQGCVGVLLRGFGIIVAGCILGASASRIESIQKIRTAGDLGMSAIPIKRGFHNLPCRWAERLALVQTALANINSKL
jgi:hypothetical protein